MPLLRFAAKSNRLKDTLQFRSGLAAAKVATAGFTGGAIRHSICERAIPTPKLVPPASASAEGSVVDTKTATKPAPSSVDPATLAHFFHFRPSLRKRPCTLQRPNAPTLRNSRAFSLAQSINPFPTKKWLFRSRRDQLLDVNPPRNCSANPNEIYARLAQEGSFSMVSYRSPLGPHRRPINLQLDRRAPTPRSAQEERQDFARPPEV
jgi:hypothetical protein